MQTDIQTRYVTSHGHLNNEQKSRHVNFARALSQRFAIFYSNIQWISMWNFWIHPRRLINGIRNGKLQKCPKLQTSDCRFYRYFVDSIFWRACVICPCDFLSEISTFKLGRSKNSSKLLLTWISVSELNFHFQLQKWTCHKKHKKCRLNNN